MNEEPDEDGDAYDGPTVCLDNGLVLPIAAMFDRLGNVTDDPFLAVVLLTGSAELGWFEIDIREQSWEPVTYH
jgi:hypothetical protein